MFNLDLDLAYAVGLSLKVASGAMVLVIPIGGGVGYILARYRFPGRRWLEAIVMLPLVLPPVAVGFFLLILLGRNGLIGRMIYQFTGQTLVFSWLGAAIAAAIVALPLMVKTTKAALENVDRVYLQAAATLGLDPIAVLWRVWLPLAWRGILAGMVLSFSRALGEFGATLMVAGNIARVTQTIPMAIYDAVQVGDDDRALVLVGLLSSLSIGAVLLSSHLEGTPNSSR
ncbi:MAG: molybdate ABC transporter permease subunit [Oscillatoriales cyanobacterium]|nr:MAG: molybdate ABC transporter permease subunit [Oscillatoriales cyanobacterium]